MRCVTRVEVLRWMCPECGAKKAIRIWFSYEETAMVEPLKGTLYNKS